MNIKINEALIAFFFVRVGILFILYATPISNKHKYCVMIEF